MKKILNMQKCIGVVLVLAMISGLVPAETAMAAKKVSISKKKLTLTMGKSVTLKLKNIKKSKKRKVKWSSSKKSVAVVNKSGKITAKKKGTAKITAKYAGKKYTCKVTVKGKSAKKTKPAVSKQDGYTILTEYLMEKGIRNVTDDGSEVYIMSTYYSDSDNMVGSIMYSPQGNYLAFTELKSSHYFLLMIKLDSREIGMAGIKYKDEISLGEVKLDLVTGDGYDSVSWIQDNILNDVGDAMYRCGLFHWNNMLENFVGISLRDLGFTSYKLKS